MKVDAAKLREAAISTAIEGKCQIELKLLIELLEDHDKLETTLKELSGFAERNSRRAEAAWKAATGTNAPRGIVREDVVKAKARWHEASRIRSVIHDRVKETLAP